MRKKSISTEVATCDGNPAMTDRSTSSQRALGWILCRQLAEQINARHHAELTAEDVHDLLLTERFGPARRLFFGKPITAPSKTFSKLTKNEMGIMIDYILRWAVEMDIHLSIPADKHYSEIAREMGL